MVGVGWLVVMDDWLRRGESARHRPRIRNRRRAAASYGLGLRTACDRDARRRGRGHLHGRCFSAIHQLRHRMDDDARLFHRLPIGSRRAVGRIAAAYISRALTRWNSIASRKDARFICRTSSSVMADCNADDSELSRRTPQRNLSELDGRSFGNLALFVIFVVLDGVSHGSTANFPRCSHMRRWFQSC